MTRTVLDKKPRGVRHVPVDEQATCNGRDWVCGVADDEHGVLK